MLHIQLIDSLVPKSLKTDAQFLNKIKLSQLFACYGIIDYLPDSKRPNLGLLLESMYPFWKAINDNKKLSQYSHIAIDGFLLLGISILSEKKPKVFFLTQNQKIILIKLLLQVSIR